MEGMLNMFANCVADLLYIFVQAIAENSVVAVLVIIGSVGIVTAVFCVEYFFRLNDELDDNRLVGKSFKSGVEDSLNCVRWY